MNWYALLAAVLLCGTSGAHATTVLRRGNLAEPQTLDVQKYSLTIEAEIIRDLFVGLLTIDADGKPVPGLAERWTVSPDGTIYTFYLRKTAVWSDGVPITAEDAIFGLRRGLDPKTESWYANLIYNIKNAEAVNKMQRPPEDLGVRAIDAHTLEITLDTPSPTLLQYLSFTPMTYPAPRHAIIANPGGWARPGTMVSSGPYKLTTWRVSDRIQLDKNPKFYDAQSVQIDTVLYYPTVDDAAALNRFRANELDLNTRFPPNQIEWLRKNLPAETKVAPALSLTYLVPNIRKAPFSDARVRKALSLAIDRSILTDRVLRNGEKPFCGIVPNVIPNYRSPCALDTRDRALRFTEARALLKAAGYDLSKPLRFVFSHRVGLTNRLAAVSIADMWKQVGVEAELLQSDVAVHYNNLREGDFELADAGWTGNADPELFTYLLLSGSSEVNWGRYSNPDYDRKTKQAEAIMDTNARYAAFAAAEAIALKDHAIIPLFLPVHRALVKAHVKGYRDNPLGSYPTRLLRLEAHPQ